MAAELLVGAAILAGTALAEWINQRTKKKALEAGTVDPGAIPGPAGNQGTPYGGTVTTYGDEQEVFTAEDMDRLVAINEAIQASIDAAAAQGVHLGDPKPGGVQPPAPGVPPTQEQIDAAAAGTLGAVWTFEDILASLPPEDREFVEGYTQLQELNALGLVTTDPETGAISFSPTVASSSWARAHADDLLMNAQYFQDYHQELARGADERTRAQVEAAGAALAGIEAELGLRRGIDYSWSPLMVDPNSTAIGANPLDQTQLDAYRAQQEGGQQLLLDQLSQAQAGEQFYGVQAYDARQRGLGSVQDYAAQLAAQEQGYRDAIAGKDPSLAALERQRALEQTQRANLAIAASARDPGAWRNALNANTYASGTAAYDAAMLRAQEIEAARAGLAGVTGQRGAIADYYSGLYGQDVGAQGGYAGLAPEFTGQFGASAQGRGQTESGVAAQQQNAANQIAMSNQGAATQMQLANQDAYATAAGANQDARVALEQSRDDYITRNRDLYGGQEIDWTTAGDARAVNEGRMADDAFFNAEDTAIGLLGDEARTNLGYEQLAVGERNNYMITMGGVMGGNANRNVATTTTAGAATASNIGVGAATVAGMIPPEKPTQVDEDQWDFATTGDKYGAG